MASHLHLLEVRIRPNAYISDVISGCVRLLQESAAASPGRIVHSYKIDGENKLMFVIDGSVDELMSGVLSSYGEQIETSCSPLRPYAKFAEDVLGMENLSGGVGWNPDGKLYWLVFDVEYKGMELSRLFEVWKQEAETAMGMVLNGKAAIFKTVAKRQVHVVISLASNDLLDNVVFTLPIIKHLGNQVQVNAHSILPLKI